MSYHSTVKMAVKWNQKVVAKQYLLNGDSKRTKRLLVK